MEATLVRIGRVTRQTAAPSLARGLAWGFMGGLAGTLIMDAVLMAALAAAGLPPLRRSVSPRLAYAAGWAFELAYAFFDLSGEPRMTRFVAEELSTSHWFDLSAAKRDLGYQPKVSTEEGLRRLKKALSTPI